MVLKHDPTYVAPKGNKQYRAPGLGEVKVKGMGDVDPDLKSFTDAVGKLIEEHKLDPRFGQGVTRALADARRNGIRKSLELAEGYQERLRSGELGNIPASKAVTDIVSLINNRMLTDHMNWFF